MALSPPKAPSRLRGRTHSRSSIGSGASAPNSPRPRPQQQSRPGRPPRGQLLLKRFCKSRRRGAGPGLAQLPCGHTQPRASPASAWVPLPCLQGPPTRLGHPKSKRGREGKGRSTVPGGCPGSCASCSGTHAVTVSPSHRAAEGGGWGRALYLNSLVLARAGEADRLRDLARPRMGWLGPQSSSPWHAEQRYEAGSALCALLMLTFSCSVATVGKQGLRSGKHGRLNLIKQIK